MNVLANRYASLAVCMSFLSLGTATHAQQGHPVSYTSSTAAQSAAATQGLLYVASSDAAARVYPITASGFTTPLYTIKGSHTGLREPAAIAVAGTGMIYVANLGRYGATASLAVVPTGNGDIPAKAIVTCSITQSYGVALDARLNIHVGDTGPYNDSAAIRTFKNNANGCAAPVSQISGSKTKLVTPMGVELDFHGRTLVADATGSVNVYDPGAIGNVAPSARIFGSQTGLTGPRAVALDKSDNVYVMNVPNYPPGPPSVLEFAHSASGNVLPIRRIGGSRTMLYSPRGIAVSKRTGEIYIADSAGVLVFAATANGNAVPIRVVRHAGGSQAVGVALRE